MPSLELSSADPATEVIPAGLVPALSLPPSSPASTSCPGADSPLSSYLCDPPSPWAWLSHAAGWVWRLLQAWWPLLAVAAVAALAVGALLAVAVRRARAEAADRASWVEITPPAVMPAEGARGLWRALAGLLSRTRRRGLVPRHLAVEFVADVTGMRAGVWVPPSLSASSVAEAIGRCWPGARATITDTPPTWDNKRVTAAQVMPRGGEWAPLLDPTHTTRRQTGEVDPLHSALSALAERGEGERACVQLVVSRARTVRHRGGDRDRPLWARIVLGILRAPFVIFLAVAEVMFTRGSSTTSRMHAANPHTPDDPAVAAHRKAIAAKQAHGPHLHATLRLAICSPASRGLRRRAVNAIVNGYDLVAPEASLHTRPAYRPARRLSQRLPGARRDRFLVTLDEAAALWHLPEQPAQYGITDATARVRRPRRDLPRYTPPNPRRRLPGQPGRPRCRSLTATPPLPSAVPSRPHPRCGAGRRGCGWYHPNIPSGRRRSRWGSLTTAHPKGSRCGWTTRATTSTFRA